MINQPPLTKMLFEINFITILLCFFISSINGGGISNDAQSLLDFKSTLPNPKILFNWRSENNPCQFTGVFCSSEPRVTSIDLSYLSLSPVFSSVSTHLFNLEKLTSLTLKSTNLTGPVLQFTSCSSSLTHLDLSTNALSGSPSPSAMAVFSTCSALTALNLSSNQFDSLGQSLTASSYSLKLQILDLSSNRLVGSSFLPWLLAGGCSHLTNLTLKGNKLEGSFSLNGCDELQHFDVSSNNFSSPMPELGKCTQLKHLDLSSNKFSGPIGDEIGGCEQLTYLNISINQFSGSIPSSLPNLQFIYMSENQLEGSIINGGGILEACPSLLEVDLSFNHLSGNLPTGLESCSSLTLFDVSNNNFSGDLSIGMFMKMNGLKKLSLASNKLIGVLPEQSLLPGLEILDLSSNNISGKIPSGLCQIHRTQLKELYLQDNLFTASIPSDLGNCTELVSLDLSFNYLTGKIPPTLGNLSNLKDLIMWMNLLDGEIPQELENIHSLENLILDYNRFTGNIPSGLRNCTNLNWISLSSNQLSGVIPSWIGSLANLAILKLSNNSFHGSIPAELGDCKSLLWLDLNSNLLSGFIPTTLSKQSGNMAVGFVIGKKYVYLRNDGSSKDCHGAGNMLEFAGIGQDSLSRIPTRRSCNFTRIYMGNTQPTFQHNGTMIFLDLSYNKLQGSIPKELGSMYYLSILDLAHNNLTGPIPSDLGRLKYMGVMDLSYNSLSGQIPPSLTGLTLLTEIDLSNNNLTGMIPDSGQFETFPPYRFYNNSGLCGYPLPRCGTASASSGAQHQKQRRGNLVGSVAMGLILSLFCIFGVIMLYVELKKRKKKQSGSDEYDDGESISGTHQANWKLTSAREALTINLAAFEKPLRKLTFADLLEATNGFHDDTMIGSGGFGDVYKAKLKDGSIVAIKKLIQISGQGDREFMAEMETIGKIKHRNLVPLLGYCKVKEERLLVYEYMQHGSLDDVLHGRKKVGIKLNWAARRKIAIGAARGLAFLHHNCIPHIIHRDMKSSNVLLDENLDARVSDFGMARLMSAMDTHLSVSTLAGTPGYVPPEYYQSFRCSTKGDVYSYGVVLLELLTGKQPTDSADFGDNNNLVGWVKLHAKGTVSDVFDRELMEEDPSLEIELLQHLKVACACLDDRPWRRPTMIQVMAMFKEIQAGGGGVDSASTIGTDDVSFTVAGSFSSIDGVDMTIKEDQESGKL